MALLSTTFKESHMGEMYEISCERCTAVTSVSEGYGFQNVHSTFEYLFLNILTKQERISLSKILPEGFESEVSEVDWSQKALNCTTCSKIGSTTHWSITLKDGKTYKRQMICSCGGEQRLITLYRDAELNARCPECGEQSLKATFIGLWD